jgi:hypothetical protein
MNELVEFTPGQLTNFKPEESHRRLTVADAGMRCATKVKDLDLFQKAAKAKVAEVRELVLWWDANVRTPGNFELSEKLDNSISAEQAKGICGFAVQRISEWRTLLARDDYRGEEWFDAIIERFKIRVGLVADPAAQRGQPLREGPDFWPTPPCLITALVRHVLPTLPSATIWECASGDGRLARAIAATRAVVCSDLYPQDGNISRDFLSTPPPQSGLIAITNPPYNKGEEFLYRMAELFVVGQLDGFVLLLRHDHLQAGGKVSILNHCTQEFHCNWRPRWIEESEGNPRWAFHWLAWHHGARQPPLYLTEADVI